MLSVGIGEICTYHDASRFGVPETLTVTLHLAFLDEGNAIDGDAVFGVRFGLLGVGILWSGQRLCYDFSRHGGYLAVTFGLEVATLASWAPQVLYFLP